MRWLSRPPRDDRGVVTLLVIGMITVLLLASAAAIDVNRYSQENSSAQHSADATAMAVATDCVRAGAPLAAASYALYRKDGQNVSPTTPISCGAGMVRIRIEKDVDAGLMLNRDARTVHKEATVRWGTLGSATTVPITIANCEFSPEILDGTTDITIYVDDPKPTSGCSSSPGGFGMLSDPEADCGVAISADGTAEGVPGGPLQKTVDCITNPVEPRLPHDVLIPMYDADACEDAGCKGFGPYPILGFAMFRITGYSFNGAAFAGTLGNKCPQRPDERPSDTPKYCLRGDFIRFVTSQGSPGPSTDFGTYQIFLSS